MMRYPFLALAVALSTVAGAAMAAAPRAGTIFLSSCRQGQCAWQRVVSFARQARSPQGELMHVVARRGMSTHLDGRLPRRPRDARIEWESANRSDWVFCSRQRPAYAFEDENGAIIVHFLDLFDLAGYQYASASAYWRLCHGRETMPGPAAMRRLGYRPGTRNGQVENIGVEGMTRF